MLWHLDSRRSCGKAQVVAGCNNLEPQPRLWNCWGCCCREKVEVAEAWEARAADLLERQSGGYCTYVMR